MLLGSIIELRGVEVIAQRLRVTPVGLGHAPTGEPEQIKVDERPQGLRVGEQLLGSERGDCQAEELDETPAKDILKRFDGIGLPHYAILRPKK